MQEFYDKVRNAEQYIHIRPEYQERAYRLCFRSLDVPSSDWCFVAVPDHGWKRAGSEYRGYRHLRPLLDFDHRLYEGERRAGVWSRKDEFWTLYFSAIRAYEEWEREALSLESIRRTVAVLSIASRSFGKEVA